MQIGIQGRRSPGVTLIELMCVIAIIAILAGMLLGPAGRALSKMRAADWADKAQIQVNDIRDRLRKKYQGETDFPTVTLGQLEADGILLPSEIVFLHDKRVVFTPFGGADPTKLVVVAVRIAPGFFTDAGTLELTQGEIVEPAR